MGKDFLLGSGNYLSYDMHKKTSLVKVGVGRPW